MPPALRPAKRLANLTTSATYSTSSSSVATVDSNGVLHGIALGVATIAVTVGSTTTTDAVTVDTATLNSITITPAAPTVPIGLTTQLTATGNYSDGSTANISSQVQWTSSTPATATVSTTGLVTAKASGRTNVTATMSSVTGTNAVMVTSAVLQSIVVQTPETSFPLGLSVQLTAIGTYSDSSTQNLTSSVTWSSQTPSIGVVNSSGLATGVRTGAFNAAATFDGVTGTLQLNVTGAVFQSIAVTPANQIIVNLPGNTLQFTATGSYTDGTTQNITNSVHWSLGGVDVGTISATGSFSSVAIGLGTVTATSGTISGTTDITVVSL
jgi:trimeric autotransporter adhesin